MFIKKVILKDGCNTVNGGWDLLKSYIIVTLEKYFSQIFTFFFMKKKSNFDNIFAICYIKTGIILFSCLCFIFIFGKWNVFDQVHSNVSYIFLAHLK